jgi:hypothetical protein
VAVARDDPSFAGYVIAVALAVSLMINEQSARDSQAAFERQSREERKRFGKAMRDPNLQRGLEILKGREEQQRADKP